MLIEEYLAREAGGENALEGAPPAAGVASARCAPARALLSSGSARRTRAARARILSATASSSIGAPVTSFSSSSAVGCWPSSHSSFRSEPASRRANQSLPNSSRRKVESCASNAHERRYEVQ